MRFATTLAFTGSIALFFAGCGEEQGAPADGAADSMQQQASDMASQAGDAWQETRDAFVAETRSRIEQLEAQVAELRAEAEQAEATEAMKSLAGEAEQALNDAKANLQNLADAGAEQWESMRTGLADALDNLEAKLREGAGG
jgi:chromosome segregation ATPase